MSNERDELAGVINRADWTARAQTIADAILAAGFRKPRTIATAEERSELLPGTVGMDADGNAWKRGTGSWVSTGGDTPALYDDMDLTLIVLHEPVQS